MKERIRGKRLILGVGWHAGQLSFRQVDFVVGMGYTQVEMPMDLKFRREHWARGTDLGFISIYRVAAQSCVNE